MKFSTRDVRKYKDLLVIDQKRIFKPVSCLQNKKSKRCWFFYLCAMIHSALSVADISCPGCKCACLRRYGNYDKNDKEDGGESWEHFEMKLLWPKECFLILIQFCCEILCFGYTAFKLIGYQASSGAENAVWVKRRTTGDGNKVTDG